MVFCSVTFFSKAFQTRVAKPEDFFRFRFYAIIIASFLPGIIEIVFSRGYL